MFGKYGRKVLLRLFRRRAKASGKVVTGKGMTDGMEQTETKTAADAPRAVTLDLTGVHTAAEVWQTLRDGMDWQDWYGSNLDALYDVLTGLPHTGRDFLLLRRASYDDPALTRLVGRVARVFGDAAGQGALTVTVRTVQSDA